MLVAPAEPRAFLELSGDNSYSTEPEKWGTDFLFYPRGLRVGCQRKECSDLIASIRSSDRIAREMAQMQALDRAVLLIEGEWGWDEEGHSKKVNGKGRDGWLKVQYDGIMLAAQANNVWVMTSTGIPDSIRVLAQVERFMEREDHRSLFTRPKVASDSWGTAKSRDWAIGFYSWFPGVSIVTAGAIYDAIGLPLHWDDGMAERLKAIPGIGPKRIKSLMGAFNGS